MSRFIAFHSLLGGNYKIEVQSPEGDSIGLELNPADVKRLFRVLGFMLRLKGLSSVALELSEVGIGLEVKSE